MLAADAASARGLRAVERVLFGGWGRTHTLRAGRPPPTVMGAAACTNRRLNVGGSRRKPPRAPGSVHRADARFELDARRHTGWLPALALRQRRTSRLRLRSRNLRAPGGAPALGPRFDGSGSPGATGLSVGGQAPSRQHLRRPVLPVVLRRRLRPIPPPFPGMGASPLCRQRCYPETPAGTVSRRASAGVDPYQGQAFRVAASQP